MPHEHDHKVIARVADTDHVVELFWRGDDPELLVIRDPVTPSRHLLNQPLPEINLADFSPHPHAESIHILDNPEILTILADAAIQQAIQAT